MDHWDLELEKTLADAEALLASTARSLDEDAELSLESILAEFGGDDAPREQTKKELTPPPMLEDADDISAPLVPTDDNASAGVTLRDVLEQTVQTVMSEQKNEPILEPPARRGLFSRRRMQETEQLYEQAEKVSRGESVGEEEPEEEYEPDIPFEETLSRCRKHLAFARRSSRAVGVLALLMWIPLAVDYFGYMPALYAEEPLLRTLPYLIFELLACIFGRGVFVSAWRKLRGGAASYELLCSLLCIVTLADTALCLLPQRADAPTAFHAFAVLSLFAALRGQVCRSRGEYDTVRVAAMGEPPYAVTVTALGAAKSGGETAGFSGCLQHEDDGARAQRVLLPVILTASLVFAALATVECGSPWLFAWNLSAILCGAGVFALPLVYPYPFRKLARRLAKSGGAVAGFAGANEIRASNCVILTDSDIFPPGTVTLNGLKIYGEVSSKVISYAATMAHASDCGLSRLFDNLLLSDGGHLQPLDDLNFYEEGGISGMIHGETVLFGTLAFFRKKRITLPKDIKLQTGVYLAVDGALVAVFAVKYMPAENVDWALHALHRSHITPVLAVRDGNITPALLKRKFGTDARAVFPKLSTRLALSERGGGRPFALLYREGLMPYAEVVLGSKRLCRAVRVGNVLAFFGSIAGVLLAFYLTFVGAYSALHPLMMLAFSALWTLAALIDAAFVDRY